MTLPPPDLTRPDFPPFIDSTMRADFVSCPHKFFWRYQRHLLPKGGNIHLHAGGAFARGCEVTRKSFYDLEMTAEDALAEGVKALILAYGDYEPPTFGSGQHKTCERLVEGLVHYFHAFPMATDSKQPIKLGPGKHAIECKFAMPLPIKHPQTGDPLLYVGRADMIVNFLGKIFPLDDKTTSQLGPTWSDSWRLRGQLDGYAYMTRELYHLGASGAIVRALSITPKNYGTAESLQLRADWQLNRWYGQLLRDIERMLTSWHQCLWDYNLSDACSAFTGCPYLSLCTTVDPEPWIENDYVVLPWNPLDVIE